MFLKLFKMRLRTRDREGIDNDSADIVHIVAKDLDEAKTILDRMIGKTYPEVGMIPPMDKHYRICGGSPYDDNDQSDVDVLIPEKFLQDLKREVEDQVVKRVMAYLPQLLDSREV